MNENLKNNFLGHLFVHPSPKYNVENVKNDCKTKQ